MQRANLEVVMAGRKKAVEAEREAERETLKKERKKKAPATKKTSTKKRTAKSAAADKKISYYNPADVDYLADCVVNNPALIGQLEQLGFKSKNPKGMTFREAMMCSQISNAIRGDIKAYRAVMDYAGEKRMRPIDKLLQNNRKRPIDKLK
jgi:hypothetical protein